MDTIALYIFGFIIIMTFVLWMIPNKKIAVISSFFVMVLPKIPLAAIFKAYNDAKENKKQMQEKSKKPF